MKLFVPESVWDDFLNPDATGMEADLGLTGLRATPFFVRRGPGGRRVYDDVPAETARELARYLYDRGDTLLGQGVVDPDDPFEKAARDTYRRAMKLADAITDEVGR